MEKIYKNWKSERGEYIEVDLVTFRDYERNSRGNIRTFIYDDKVWIGEKWVAASGAVYTKRKPFEPHHIDNDEDFAYSYSKPDDVPNEPANLLDETGYILDYNHGPMPSINDISHKRRYPNKHLQRVEEKDIEKIKLISRFLRAEENKKIATTARIHLNILTKPSLFYAKRWRQTKGKERDAYLNRLQWFKNIQLIKPKEVKTHYAYRKTFHDDLNEIV